MTKRKYTTVEEQIEFGLETIDPERKIEVSLRDFMYVYQTVGELNRFFHQPMHYKNLEDVEKFIGNRSKGAYAAIHRCYYQAMPKHFPKDIDDELRDGEVFENPLPPYYYKPNEE